MIVAGYAFTPFEDNKIRILNLENTKEAAVIDKNGNMIETTMNDASLMLVQACSVFYTVTGTTYYLALRNGCSYNSKNEIGKLYNGETVEYIRDGKNGYWYVNSRFLK